MAVLRLLFMVESRKLLLKVEKRNKLYSQTSLSILGVSVNMHLEYIAGQLVSPVAKTHGLVTPLLSSLPVYSTDLQKVCKPA